jgi:DNA-binding FrmR family transcriptional regulator
MVHAVTDKRKLFNRVHRLRGQIEAIERALGADAGCTQIVQQLTAARGAITSLIAEVVEDHIRVHMIDATRMPTVSETEAADELVSVLRSYIR